MGLSKIRLGDYIERSTVNNKNLQFGTELISGVNNNGIFSSPKGNPEGVDLKPYKIVNNGAFVYNPTRLNLGSIAYRTQGLCIVSHLYMIFYLSKKGLEIINPLWLYIYFRRNEFYREVTFRNFGSQRPEFSFNDMSDIVIPLPPIDIQQKYVAIYSSMLANQQNYERGLGDLKLTCDAYIEELRRSYNLEALKPYIYKHDIKNGKDSDNKNVMGISVYKQFREPTSKVNRNELANYKIVKPRQFGFVQTTHNEKVFAYALNTTNKDILISSVNEVFSVDETKLIPEFLAMFFNRKEFDRYARFHSWGSARETFTWDDLINVKIPIPNLQTQQSIVNIYNAYMERKKINEQLKEQIRSICPILIKGSLEEAKNRKDA